VHLFTLEKSKKNPMTHYKLGILERKNYEQLKDH